MNRDRFGRIIQIIVLLILAAIIFGFIYWYPLMVTAGLYRD